VSSRRTLILIGAVVIGGLAAFLTLNYVRGVESDNAEQNQLVEVLVASGEIPKGSSADEALQMGLIEPANRRRADLPVGAVTRNAEIQGQVAAVALNGGEIITTSMFVSDTDLSGSNATSLDKGNVAMTISVDEASGVAGLIQPGDSINIMANIAVTADEEGEGVFRVPDPAGEQDIRFTNPSVYALQDVKVLAVGQSLGAPVATVEGEEAPPPPTNTGLITVQLPPDQAVLLASVRQASLFLTLNRPDYEPVPVPFFSAVPTMPGIQGVSPYPAEPNETDGQ
jgi:pilus assembly protein CpaB